MKIKRIILIFIILLSCIFLNISYGIDTAIMESQSEALGISSFLDEANKYSKDLSDDIDIKEIFTSAIGGNIDNSKIFKNVFGLFGKEVVNCLQTLGSVLVIIIIHSVLKSISDNLENKSISQIIYYVQYILIVAIVMINFTEIIKMIGDTINNLVGFTYNLIPLLLTLMVTTGNIISANVMQPILLFLITFIGNIISSFILPLILIGTTLGIISNISDRVQIDKLSKFFKSATLWSLGIILTLFVTVLSLEGTLSSTVDRYNSQNC